MELREYSLNYSPELLRSAGVAFVRRSMDYKLVASLIALGGFAIYLFMAGDRSWRVGAASVTFFVVATVLASVLVFNIKHARATARELAGQSVSFSISEQGLGFKSSLGNAEIPWSNIAAAYSEPRYLLLFFRRGGYTSVPLQAIDAEAIASIKEMVLAKGGKVV